MSRKNTQNGGCSCESCRYTDSLKQWPLFDLSDIKLAKYRRAIDQHKVPNDPIYTAHVRASRFVADLEFTAAELNSRAVKVYRAPNPLPADVAMPAWGWTTTAEYIKGFDEKNSLKPVEYAYSWGPTDMRSQSIAA